MTASPSIPDISAPQEILRPAEARYINRLYSALASAPPQVSITAVPGRLQVWVKRGRRWAQVGSLAVAIAPGLTGCASLTAAEIANQAMRGCPVTHELQVSTTLTTTSTRVVCTRNPG